MAEQIKTRMTAEEFLNLPESMQPMELIEGELIVSPSPIPIHQKLVRNITRRLEDLVTDGEVIPSPMDVHLDDDTVLQPDIFWASEQGKCIELSKHFRGAPDLIVEILSVGTAVRDKRDKFQKYEEHGVREYWIVDPLNEYFEIWQLKDSHFIQLGVYNEDEVFESVALAKTVSLANIFPHYKLHDDSTNEEE